jgi:type IV secretory pathway VirB2 component (pilin)
VIATRSHSAAYLAAAFGLAVAFVYLPIGSHDPVAIAHRGDKLAALGLVMAGLLGPLIVIGVIVTGLYLWFRLPFLRHAYLTLLFGVLVGDITLLMADGWKNGFLTCWDCDGPMVLARGILPGSLFMLIPLPTGSFQRDTRPD